MKPVCRLAACTVLIWPIGTASAVPKSRPWHVGERLAAQSSRGEFPSFALQQKPKDRLSTWSVAWDNALDFSDQGNAPLDRRLLPPIQEEQGAAVRTVEVTGIGASPADAQRDAARLAVQQVAGLYIDARRRVESKITDKAASEFVQEKILSYTNAYITKLDVTKVEKKDGVIVVQARVAVRVAPLIKALQSGNIPTVPFDTATAVGQVEVSGREKASAIDLYADLLKHSDNLIKLAVGKPKLDVRLQAPADRSWLSIPVTFIANDEAIKEWRTKFELIASQRARLQVSIQSALLNRSDPAHSCSAPVFDTAFALNNGVTEQTFTGTVTPEGEHGVVACFATSTNSNGAALECLGRRVLDSERPSPDICGGPACLSFKATTRPIGMALELIDAAGSVIETIPLNFSSFPMLNVGASRAEPTPQAQAFFNYCAPDQQPFYALAASDAAYGDVMVLPAPGSRFKAYGNFLLPNTVIARIASIRMSVVNREQGN